MKHIVCFSGGKDSTALILWAKEHLPEFTTVFCDTGWEHPWTYAYVYQIDRTLLNGGLRTFTVTSTKTSWTAGSTGRCSQTAQRVSARRK